MGHNKGRFINLFISKIYARTTAAFHQGHTRIFIYRHTKISWKLTNAVNLTITYSNILRYIL